MRVAADREVCIGSGNCVFTANDVFDQDDDEGLVVLLTAEVGPRDADAVRDAVAHCPSGALRIIED
ncbi:MAG: ferredoxin [Modestobacter sp.]|nr:ferredoxin [Modestobacter sp.]